MGSKRNRKAYLSWPHDIDDIDFSNHNSHKRTTKESQSCFGGDQFMSESTTHLKTSPVLLLPSSPLVASPVVPGAALVVTPAAAVIDTHTNRVRVHAPRVRQLELQARVVVVQEVRGVVHAEELDERDAPAPFVVPEPDDLDVVGVEDLGVGGHAREAVQDVVLGRVAGETFDDDRGRGPAGRSTGVRVVSARGS